MLCLCKDCVPVCLIQSQLQSPALRDASPTLQSTEREHSKQQHSTGPTHPHTPFPLCFPSLVSLTFLSLHEKETCQEIKASEISRDVHPLYLGRLGEFLLLWPAVQLVQHHSVRTFGRCWLSVPDSTATTALGRFQLGKQTPAGKRGKEERRISLRYGCRLILCWLCCCTCTLLLLLVVF